ncbi:MAG: RNA polymerase-associated protein RapA [Gammaproteobacteria bacterium]
MEEFSLGQRWISTAELQLGIGTIVGIEHRTVSIDFPAAAETRFYSRQNAPLSRVRFIPGDAIQNQLDEDLTVVSVHEDNGLINYLCRNDAGIEVDLPEGELNSYLQLNRPAERLFSTQIDRNKWYSLRNRAREISNSLLQSPVYGLAGCRTSFIAHQLYIAHEVSQRYAPRVLLADEVGLGKTIEAGLILHHQLLLERAKRVLIVVPETLIHQWLVEMLRRFNLMFSVFNEARLEGYEDAELNDLENPFHSEQLVICSLQFLVDNPEHAAQAELGEWDLLVVDEAHHLAWSTEAVSPEYQLVDSLARSIPGVLLLTATPEQLGKESHFARLRLLDPNRFNDLGQFLNEESHYAELADLVSALQEDVALDQTLLSDLEKTVGKEDNQLLLAQLESQDDDERHVAQAALIEHLLDRHGTGRVLFRNTRHVIKGFPERELHGYPLAAPDAWLSTLSDVERPSNDSTAESLQWLLSPEQLPDIVSATAGWLKADPRVEWLGQFLTEHKNQKVLVITAFANTALALVQQVKAKYGLRAAVFYEGMSLVERDRAAAYFADHEEGSQVLVCSEIGSEGRNFQFAHHLVLFDLPLNPDLLEQRIGRLDRIGQIATIHIHVPYMKETAQEVMYRWYHESLSAFTHTCPAGHQVYVRSEQELHSVLMKPSTATEEFFQSSRELHAELDEALQLGRDRLLEINSCRPHVADELADLAIAQDYDLDIFSFMEKIYDCFGVNSEMHSLDCWIITPGDNMLTVMPGLPEDGMTVTYKRNVALANEDVQFLSWEHPFVRNAIDLVLSSEFGNTALVAIKYPKVKPGTLLLDCQFLMEFSDNKKMGNQRYFPNSTVAVVMDESDRDHSHALDHNSIEDIKQVVDLDTSVKIVRAKKAELSKILKTAEAKANESVSLLVAAAQKNADQVIKKEINRLVALQAINTSVRDEEIDFFRQQLMSFEAALTHAKLRLDAVRVMIAI